MAHTAETIQSMLNDGWVDTKINGIRCFVLDNEGGVLIAQNNPRGFMTKNAYNRITRVRGEPYKVHTLRAGTTQDNITTIEY